MGRTIVSSDDSWTDSPVLMALYELGDPAQRAIAHKLAGIDPKEQAKVDSFVGHLYHLQMVFRGELPPLAFRKQLSFPEEFD